jgi:hypothetical protein
MLTGNCRHHSSQGVVMKKFLRIGALSLFLLSATGCGGGGGDDDGGSPGGAGAAEGAYYGSTGNGYATVGLVLDDGSYWFIYFTADSIGGAVQGSGKAGDGGSFSSSNGKDFNIVDGEIYDVDVVATAVAATSLNGSLNYDDGSKTAFTTNYEAGYTLTPSLSTLAGTYSGLAATSEGEDQATTTISSSGAITGTSQSGCTYSGNATPREHGNVYDVSLNFGGGVCTNGTDTVKGVAYYDASLHGLFSAAANGGRTDGFIFVGSKT